MSYLMCGKPKFHVSRSGCCVKARKRNGSKSVGMESTNGHVFPLSSPRPNHTEDEVLWQWLENLTQANTLNMSYMFITMSFIHCRNKPFPIFDGVFYNAF